MARTIVSVAILGGALLLLPAPVLADPPVPVSPGSPAGTLVRDACPTFSWSRTRGTDEVELVVFPFTPEGELAAAPALAVRLPAGSHSWTPPADRCLRAGGRYAWSLRELGEEPAAAWSEAAIFDVAAPSRAEVHEALETLRRYLADGGDASAGGDETEVDRLDLHLAFPPSRSVPSVPSSVPPVSSSLASLVHGGFTKPSADQSHAVGRVAVHAVESTTTGNSYGVFGESVSNGGVGVAGEASSTAGGAMTTGVSGRAVGSLGRGVFGLATHSSGQTQGVYGLSDSSLGNGVLGIAGASQGQTIGVQGASYSAEGTGVRGNVLALTGLTRGVIGEIYSPGGIGVYGRASVNSGEAVGVRGLSLSTQGVGVWGEAPAIGGKAVFGYAAATTGENFGVYGITESSAGWAGFFGGRVGITGSLSKGSGTFKIDHPLDPANRYLSHSFVESPDMMNVYNGNVALDEEGAGWVELPEWFEALNRDFRYQLTALDHAAPGLHVAERVAGNRFRIAGGKPGTEVSWQVTGIRRDAYAERNPVLVEEDKGELRGRYLHPEAHGQPVELAIGRVGPPPLEAAEATEDGGGGPPVPGHAAVGKGADAPRPLSTGGER